MKADQNHQAQYILSKQEKSLSGEWEVGAGRPAARGSDALIICHGMDQRPKRHRGLALLLVDSRTVHTQQSCLPAI